MMKKGFTLIELLAVITIIGILSVLAVPPILNQVNKNKGMVNDTNYKIIEHAALLYVGDSLKVSTTYCMTLQDLVDSNLLATPINNFEEDKDMSLTKVVKVVSDTNKKITLTLQDNNTGC